MFILALRAAFFQVQRLGCYKLMLIHLWEFGRKTVASCANLLGFKAVISV